MWPRNRLFWFDLAFITIAVAVIIFVVLKLVGPNLQEIWRGIILHIQSAP